MSSLTPELDLELETVVAAVKRNNFIVLNPFADDHTAIQIDGIALYTRVDNRGREVERRLVALVTDTGASLRGVGLNPDNLPILEEDACSGELQGHSSSIFEVVEMFNRQILPTGRHRLVVLAVR